MLTVHPDDVLCTVGQFETESAMLMSGKIRNQAAVFGCVQVGDQSDFVNVFSRVLGDVGPKIGAALNLNYFRFFCDKLANSFTPRFYEYIFRCTHLSTPLRS